MADSAGTSIGTRIANGAAAGLAGVVAIAGSTLGDVAGKLAEPPVDATATHMVQSVREALDAEKDRRERSEMTDDAIENPQEAPSIIEPRDKSDVLGDEVSPEVAEPEVMDSLAAEMGAGVAEAPESVVEVPDALAPEVGDALADMGPAPDMFGGPVEPGPMGEPGGDAAMGGGPF